VYFGFDVFGRGTFGGGGLGVTNALTAITKAGVSAALFAPGWTLECHERSEFEAVQELWWRRVREPRSTAWGFA
jgi:mannosyl-glycoprotein endo-beta-N-acetylglucosaminidase